MTTAAPAKRTGRKRGHGEGTIYQRPDGLWSAQVSLPDGKRKTVYAKTRKEVQDKLTATLSDVRQGLPVPTRQTTVGQFLDTWLTEVIKPRLRWTTYRSYEQNVRNHITPVLGKVKLADLAAPQIQSFLNTKQTAGLSPRSVQYIHDILRGALNQAVDWNLIPRNPIERARRPRAERFQAPTLTPDDARAVLDAVRCDRLEAVVTVALAVGLRQGEALGLTWADVNFDAGTITVNRQLQRVAGEYQRLETKSRESRRQIPLPASVIEGLRGHRIRQLEERLALGARWKGNPFDLVFTTTVGTPLDGVKVTRRFQDRLDRAGLRHLRFHDLRHGAASLLLAQGVHPRVVMEMLGHSQISLTLGTYSHVMPSLTREAADRMNDLIAGVAEAPRAQLQ